MSRKPQTRDPLRWLHISDFHTGKDPFGQQQLFKYLLKEIQTRVTQQLRPDFIFITGDIANKGKVREYETFLEQFLLPLLDLLGNDYLSRVFIIPGNHDVDREKAPGVDTYTVLSRISRYLDPTQEGLDLRRNLLSRFEAFADDLDCGWLFSKEGVNVKVIQEKNVALGLLCLNKYMSRNFC